MKIENDSAARRVGEIENGTAAKGSEVESPGVTPAVNPASDLPDDLPGAYRKVVSEKQDLYDRLLRKQAEFENFRKRTERDKDDFVKQATADLIRALLPALDPQNPHDYFLFVSDDNDFITQNGYHAGVAYKDPSGVDVDTMVLVYRVTLPN